MPIVIENLDIQVQEAPPTVQAEGSEDAQDHLAAVARESQLAQRKERQVVD